MNLERPDVLVIGGGSAGAAAAAFLAEAGRSVLLVDARAPEAAGARWANGVPGWCFDVARVERPAPPERLRTGATYRALLCSADGSRRIEVPADPLIHLDMPSLVARLQARARAAGAEIRRERAVGVEMDGRRVAAVRLSSFHDREERPDERPEKRLDASPDERPEKRHNERHQERFDERICRPLLTVDASGMAAVVRRSLPHLERFAAPLGPNDICVAEQGQHVILDKDGAKAFLATHGARPGEAVSFMGRAGGYSVVMAGVDESLEEVAVLAGSIPMGAWPDGRSLRRAFLAELPWIGAARQSGGAQIPLGRPLLRPAAPGVAVLGDAAGHVFGLHGSGVGMGFLAARQLADALGRASDPGDEVALHRYSSGFLRTYGGRLAAADVFRRFSQTLSADDIAALMEEGLVNHRSMSAGLMHAPFEAKGLSLGSVLRSSVRLPLLFGRAAAMGARLLAAQRLFDHYPLGPDEAALARFQRALGLLLRQPWGTDPPGSAPSAFDP
ncbi:MAG: FAD-dependent oxidoreductase [Polyangia bacterium]|jgi:flavin-dependent dehydrogenase|nr:FAD-dependent oxidoreductase [Polyangia bacterium]